MKRLLTLMVLMLASCERPEESDAYVKMRTEDLNKIARQDAEIKRLNNEMMKLKDQRDRQRSESDLEKGLLTDRVKLLEDLLNQNQQRTLDSVRKQLDQIDPSVKH